MIAQIALSTLLFAVMLYAYSQLRRSPAVGYLALLVAGGGFYFVWIPEHATALAHLAGIGRGVDLIVYIWMGLSLLVLLNLHLKMRMQMELITKLTRALAIANASEQTSRSAQ